MLFHLFKRKAFDGMSVVVCRTQLIITLYMNAESFYVILGRIRMDERLYIEFTNSSVGKLNKIFKLNLWELILTVFQDYSHN